MTPNYNSVALFYDRLSRILYGNALIEAQVYLLKYIPADSKVLIVGGGTGWILEELSKLQPSGLNITYVEMAEKMMNKSMKRFKGKNKLEFLRDDIKNVTATTRYDVVMTPFFFDNFSEQNAKELFEHINTLIKPGGVWLYSDFQLTGKKWQSFLLKSMLLFFRIVCNIQATKLPDIIKFFKFHGYTPFMQQTFFADFVVSTAYQSQQKAIGPN